MNISVCPKSTNFLMKTRLLQQTSYWSEIKEDLGWVPSAFDILAENETIGDVLILQKQLGNGRSMAYAPYGPECFPESDLGGTYLVSLSQALRDFLGPGCIFVRFDIPWESPYADDPERYDDEGNWLGLPETRLVELRMNWGVESVGLRKAPSDLLPPDTIILDIEKDDEDLLTRMHPKTRYNIRLADRHDVAVREGTGEDISLWNSLYRETAGRNNITPHGPEYFTPLFDKKTIPDTGEETDVKLLVAEAGGTPLAAMFMSVSSDRAAYLYGASSDRQRNLMAPYALQWYAIQKAKEAGCTSYDFFGVSPSPDPAHPMYGLYRFKRGFGGDMFHRQGAWDFPYDEPAYTQYRGAEFTAPGFNI